MVDRWLSGSYEGEEISDVPWCGVSLERYGMLVVSKDPKGKVREGQ